MTKKELLPLAKTYFDSNPQLAFIFGTEDKHFYFTEGDVKYYCKGVIKHFKFIKNDFDADLVAKNEAEEKITRNKQPPGKSPNPK